MKTHWYRNGTRGAFHHESADWVRSGKALCGRPIKNPGWTFSTEGVADILPRCTLEVWRERTLADAMRHGMRLCLDCLARSNGGEWSKAGA